MRPAWDSSDEPGSQGFQRPYGREGGEREAKGGVSGMSSEFEPGVPVTARHIPG